MGSTGSACLLPHIHPSISIFIFVSFFLASSFFPPTAGVDKCAWQTRVILHLLLERGLCVQRRVVNIPAVLTLQIWSSLLQSMEGFQVHLGVTSEILIRVRSISWAFWVEGKGRANRVDARRLQTERLENYSACTHEQVALQDSYRFPLLPSLYCSLWTIEFSHWGWVAQVSMVKSKISRTFAFHGRFTSQVAKDEGGGERSDSRGQNKIRWVVNNSCWISTDADEVNVLLHSSKYFMSYYLLFSKWTVNVLPPICWLIHWL